MDSTQLEYFKVIAETGSLTKAAAQLHISQPAMSAMLKKFEEELGVTLFDRSPNRIHLNPIGEIALVHTTTILRNIEQMKADLRSAARQQLTIAVAFCDPGVRWFSVPRFSLSRPDIQIHDEMIDDGDVFQLLHSRSYDVVITPERISDSQLVSQPFLPDRVYLSLPSESPLGGRTSLALAELPAQPLLYPQIGGYFLRQLEALINDAALPLTLVKNDFNITQHLIRTTNFLATVSRLSLDLRNDGTHRVNIPLEDSALSVLYHATFLKSNRDKVAPLLDWARAIREADAFPT